VPPQWCPSRNNSYTGLTTCSRAAMMFSSSELVAGGSSYERVEAMELQGQLPQHDKMLTRHRRASSIQPFIIHDHWFA
jgi:hypothetical protein